MNDASVPKIVDFTLVDDPKRKYLYFKRPKGTPIPAGIQWKCLCGTVNVLNANVDQYCAKCGSRLRNQENDNPAHDYFTRVVVSHINTKPPPPRR